MSLSPMQVTPRDVFRARAMFKQVPDLAAVDPYELLDESGDPDLRRVLIIWCVQSRTNPDFTWDQAWDAPFRVMFPDEDDDAVEAAPTGEAPPPTPGPESNGSEPGVDSSNDSSSSNGASKPKRRAAAAAPSSSTSSA